MRYRRRRVARQEIGAGIGNMRNMANMGVVESESNTATMSSKKRSSSHN